MDRDNNWDREEKAYAAFVYGEGEHAANAAEALSVAYDYLVVMSTFLLSAYVLHTYRSALQGMGFTTAPMLSGLTEFAGRVGASLLLTRVIGERGLFYTDAAAWTFAAVFLAASYYIQLFIIRKKRFDLSKYKVTKEAVNLIYSLFALIRRRFLRGR